MEFIGYTLVPRSRLNINHVETFVLAFIAEVEALQATGIDRWWVLGQDLPLVNMAQSQVVKNGLGNTTQQQNGVSADHHAPF